ncbi:hypothetical protein [Achromobacter anxifer]
MNRIFRFRMFWGVLAYFFLSGPTSAADIAASMNNQQPIEVSAIGDSANRVGSPVFLTLAFKNVSSVNQILTNVNAEIDASANGRFDGGGFCKSDMAGEYTLAPGETYSLSCRFPVPVGQRSESSGNAIPQDVTNVVGSRKGWSDQSWYDSLFNAKLRLFVDVAVENIGPRDANDNAESPVQNFRFFPIVPVQASETSIFVGGAVGAMLLAVFVWVERLLRNPEVREQWVRNIFVTFLTGLRGALLSAIALLLGQTTQGVGSPVVLTVTDFSGGVLIGLFSYPLAAWISSTLRLNEVFVTTKNNEAVH